MAKKTREQLIKDRIAELTKQKWVKGTQEFLKSKKLSSWQTLQKSLATEFKKPTSKTVPVKTGSSPVIKDPTGKLSTGFTPLKWETPKVEEKKVTPTTWDSVSWQTITKKWGIDFEARKKRKERAKYLQLIWEGKTEEEARKEIEVWRDMPKVEKTETEQIKDEVKKEEATGELKTLKERVTWIIAWKKTREELLKEEREATWRKKLEELRTGFRTQALEVQEDLENITKWLEAEWWAITKIAASRIREARSAPLREQLASFVKGIELANTNIQELDQSVEAMLEAKKLDRQEKVQQLSNQIESSNLTAEEKNRLQTQLGIKTARMDREDELQVFRQKEILKTQLETLNKESLAKTWLTAEQNLQSAKIIQDFDVKEDSIAWQSIRKLFKEGKTPEQIRKILGLAEDVTWKIDDEQFTRQEKLRKEFEWSEVAKNYLKAQAEYWGLLANIDEATWPWDIAVLFQFMKTLDPTSVVRESEFDAIATAMWFEDRIDLNNNIQNIKSWTLLWSKNANARKRIKDIAKNLFEEKRVIFDDRARKYISLAKEAWVNPKSVILDYDDIPWVWTTISEEELRPISWDSEYGDIVNYARWQYTKINSESDDNTIWSFLDDGFKQVDQTTWTKEIPTSWFSEQISLKRTWTNVAKDTNNPWNITADSIPSGFTKESYGKRIWATWTYLSPNGREYYVFPDVKSWTNALKWDLTAKITGRSWVIKPTDTLARFQRVYVWEVSPWYLAVLKRITWANENTKIKDISPVKLTEAVMQAEGFKKVIS